jgi:hypothetical protein
MPFTAFDIPKTGYVPFFALEMQKAVFHRTEGVRHVHLYRRIRRRVSEHATLFLPTMSRNISAFFATLVVLYASANAVTIVHDTFADGDRTNQDLANNSLALFKTRSGTTVASIVGSVTFNPTNAAGADMFYGHFTDSGAPVTLGVGDTLTFSLTMSFTGLAAASNSLRFGLFDSLGTRQTADLTGGANNTNFTNDTGYALFTALNSAPATGNAFTLNERTTFTNGNLFGSSSDFTTVGSTGTPFQALSDGQDYVLTYSIFRQTDTDTVLSAGISGGALSNYSHMVTDTSTPQTSFDYFAFRIPGNTFATNITFKDINVTTTIAVPEPSTLALLAMPMMALFARRKRSHV